MSRGQGTWKCGKCERVFGMKAHLARHMNTIHAPGGAKTKAKRKGKVRLGRPPGKKSSGRPLGRPVGRPAGIVARLGLREMTLEQLGTVIAAAREEAQNKIAEYQQAFS